MAPTVTKRICGAGLGSGPDAGVDVQDLAGDEGCVLEVEHGVTMSLISPIRPAGCSVARNSWCSSGCMEVLMVPRATAWTRSAMTGGCAHGGSLQCDCPGQ